MNDDEQSRQKWESTEGADEEQSTRRNVKEEWNGTYLYLPDKLKRDFQLAYKSTSLTYQQEVGSELPKMRAYYPLVIKLGVEAVESMDADDLDGALAALQAEYLK